MVTYWRKLLWLFRQERPLLSVLISWCVMGLNLNVMTILVGFGLHLPDYGKKINNVMHSHKILTPTGTLVPVKNVKEISSIDPSWQLTLPFSVLSTKTAIVGKSMSVTVKTRKVVTIQGQIRHEIWRVDISTSAMSCLDDWFDTDMGISWSSRYWLSS